MSTMSYKRYMYSYIICKVNFRVKKGYFLKKYKEVPQHELVLKFCVLEFYKQKYCANEHRQRL